MPGYGLRRFTAGEEIVAQMEQECLNRLQEEAKGVEQHLADLKKQEE